MPAASASPSPKAGVAARRWATGGPLACCRGRAFGCDLSISRMSPKKIWKILQSEGFTGGYTIVKDAVLRGKRSLTKRQLLTEDRIAAIALPDDTFDYRKTASTFVSSESLVRYDTNDYSAPVSSAHHPVTVKAPVSFIEVYQQDMLIARHGRCWDRERQIFDPMHYLELLERKPGSLDHARPLEDWHLPDCFNTYRRCLETHRDNGTKEYIQILLLLNKYSVMQIHRAIRKALNYRIYCYDAILQAKATA